MALVVSLVAGVAIGALAVRAVAGTESVKPVIGMTTYQPQVGPMAPKAAAAAAVRAEAAAAAAAEASFANYSRIVAGISVAESRHDFAAKARFTSQLDAALTPQTIGLVYQEHERLVQALASADRDSLAAMITRDIAALCGPATVKASLSFCN
jgi:hypothetical protein